MQDVPQNEGDCHGSSLPPFRWRPSSASGQVHFYFAKCTARKEGWTDSAEKDRKEETKVRCSFEVARSCQENTSTEDIRSSNFRECHSNLFSVYCLQDSVAASTGGYPTKRRN